MAIHIDSQLPPLDQRKMALLGGVQLKYDLNGIRVLSSVRPGPPLPFQINSLEAAPKRVE